MRLAFITEPLTRFGGAERVLLALHEIHPDAPIFTPYADRSVAGRFFPVADIRTSFLQRLPWRAFGPKALLPLLPVAIESFDLRDYDTVISSSSAFAKGVVTRSHARHISYIHTPPRFLWEDRHLYLDALSSSSSLWSLSSSWSWFVRLGAAPVLHWLRTWDQHTAHRVDSFLANSRYTAARIKKYWQKDADVLYPPVDTQSYGEKENPFPEKPYWLLVARLTPHKRVALAVQAFQRLPALSLVVVGEGPEAKRLKVQAPQNAVFLPWQEEKRLRTLMAHAECFLMPQVEDFGIAAVEAMAEGTPALAYRGGGALETVREGETGEFFDDFDVFSLADGVRRIREGIRQGRYERAALQEHAQQFSADVFRRVVESIIPQV